MAGPRVLSAVHKENEMLNRLLSLTLRQVGGSLDTVATLDEMLEKAKRAEHGIYVMSANLGNSASPDFDPANKVHEILGDRVKEGKAWLFCVSGSPETVENVRNVGLNAAISHEALPVITDYIKRNYSTA